MRRRRVVAPLEAPCMNPCDLIAMVRMCVPDRGRILTIGLRALLPQMDAVAYAVRLAEEGRLPERVRYVPAP